MQLDEIRDFLTQFVNYILLVGKHNNESKFLVTLPIENVISLVPIIFLIIYLYVIKDWDPGILNPENSEICFV